MFSVCGTRMHAGGATSTPQLPHGTTADRCVISRGRRLLVIHSGAIDFSAAWPDVRPHRRIGQTTSLADHWRASLRRVRWRRSIDARRLGLGYSRQQPGPAAGH